MNLTMVGIDFAHAPIAEREQISLVRGQVIELLPRLRASAGVSGCVLLATCNRTELYLHTDGAALDPLAVLCRAVGLRAEALERCCVRRTDGQAAEHLMAVAAGLESQIFGDDQIITQVREAAALARETGSLDGFLDTLFRRAVTAGKRVKSELRLTRVPSSAASRGVMRAQEILGALAGKRAVVIGNGEMGRLSASELRKAGCAVTVTLRTYRHGETIVPAGCLTHPYDDRYAVIEGAELVVSATASPHFTLSRDRLEGLSRRPSLLIDLAMPRDIDSAVRELPGITVLDLDDLGERSGADEAEAEAARQLIDEAMADFHAWYEYRASLPVIAALKDAVYDRVRHDHAYAGLIEDDDIEGAVALAAHKTVDLLLGGMKEIVEPERLSTCLEQIRKGSGT